MKGKEYPFVLHQAIQAFFIEFAEIKVFFRNYVFNEMVDVRQYGKCNGCS